MKNKNLWISLMVFATVFALAALAIFIMALFGIRVFSTGSPSVMLSDVLFLVSALVLSSVIITISIYLSRR
ncbi:MAG: hypothetical protein IKM18_10130 [Clostridia bacterium]|nr:hypothetical protein [Clostridia bacterium]MBR3716252.1 hypothetical protein [Clostridia bacterium]